MDMTPPFNQNERRRARGLVSGYLHWRARRVERGQGEGTHSNTTVRARVDPMHTQTGLLMVWEASRWPDHQSPHYASIRHWRQGTLRSILAVHEPRSYQEGDLHVSKPEVRVARVMAVTQTARGSV